MKKTFLISAVFLLISLIIPHSRQSVSAAGQKCCPNTGYYDSDPSSDTYGMCVWQPYRGSKQSIPTACVPGESCIGSDAGSAKKGICTEPGGGAKCCDIGHYDSDSSSDTYKKCVWQPYRESKQSKSSNCSADQWCSNNTCVSGTPYTSVQTEAKLYCDAAGNFTNDPNITGKLYTAIGCIPIQNSNELIGFILRWAIGIGGGIAFLLIILAGFQIMTSAGNPDRLKAGQELMTSAIAGLMLLIFSVFILKIIGVDILELPGFGGS